MNCMFAVMLSKPKLVQHQIDQDLASVPTPVQTTKPAPTPNKGNARFLMGLNNRVAKLDKRLTVLEMSLNQLSQRQIGFRELGLTLALALLLFTSTALVIRDTDSKFEEKLVAAIASSDSKEDKAQAASWLQALTNHPTLLAWSDEILSPFSPSNHSNYQWPLEKQPNFRELTYANHKQGIRIQAKLGDPIVAIDEGKVLFSGSGIADYGNLILIQHANDIISVYGNNYSNYVEKGQPVKKGELIASVGESSGNVPKLYFEIRFQGKAQDPFLYFQ